MQLALKVINTILKHIPKCAGSQSGEDKTGEVWSCLFVVVQSLAAELFEKDK